ncbi:putative bifunctional diguanylate cyclase/phosphodiesterase [Vibrio sp. TRT 21S02]|uniref:putative bifunctional diguanylate cyclase/phosphodiesterase n=1 Tax=Vibrio sp. TRT 21S02 TaxID=3418507 RepID=UPI003CF1948A
MKLNTRVLLLVAPVVLLGAALSSYSIYTNQKDSLIKRENSYLQLTMEKLAGHFRQSSALLNSYSLTLTKSDVIGNYFTQHNTPYRELEVLDNLQNTIATLQTNNQDNVAVTILDNQMNMLFFADNRNDPFSKQDQNVLDYVRQVFAQSQQKTHIGYTHDYQGDTTLIRYDILDKHTLRAPLSYETDDVFFIIVHLSLNKFNDLRRIIELDNDSSIFFSDDPVIRSGMTQSVELKPGLFATLDPARYLLERKLNRLEHELMLSYLASSTITVLLLSLLLYRHVTRPIARIDHQLQLVELGKRSNIERLSSEDEIGRLSARVYDMYNELNSSYQKTKAMAEYDHLTQLANRYQFQMYVKRILANKLNNLHAWILYIDLDNFKYVNDKYGHHQGDSLLVNFAEHVRSLCKEYELKHGIKCLASRLSGDEFAIFISSAHKSALADALATAILEPIQANHNSPLGNFPITASIGIACYPEDGDNITSLLSHADTAMYQAKRAGKNQVAYYSQELDSVVRRKAQIERALRSGRLDDEFSLLYQPYFDALGTNVVGVEALLRWHSPKLGTVTPSEFIPIAEQTGLFGAIDRWVINQAFHDFVQLQQAHEHPIQLSINLSSAELDSLQLAKFIEAAAEQHKVVPHLVDFEITETFATDSQSYSLLHELSLMGYKLAIDDFGSGYTSITQLVEYPVQKIKLDREFLSALLKTNNQKVIKPLVELCHSQSMKVTAEGIESAEIHRWLAENDCDYMQGFYLSKPLTLQEITHPNNLDNGAEHESEEDRRSFA